MQRIKNSDSHHMCCYIAFLGNHFYIFKSFSKTPENTCKFLYFSAYLRLLYVTTPESKLPDSKSQNCCLLLSWDITYIKHTVKGWVKSINQKWQWVLSEQTSSRRNYYEYFYIRSYSGFIMYFTDMENRWDRKTFWKYIPKH